MGQAFNFVNPSFEDPGNIGKKRIEKVVYVLI